jgi:hypothetical protein
VIAIVVVTNPGLEFEEVTVRFGGFIHSALQVSSGHGKEPQW